MHGISTADFYLTVPTAVVRFLESDSHTKQLAKPQLRGAEGQELTPNLGDQIPVVSTVFGAAAAGGFASIPQSSFTYKDVGVNIVMTPRVTYEGEIILDLSVESSNLGASVSVAGQDVPSFGSRRVKTRLRLREGESNLLAGLLKDDQRKILTGFPGLIRVPGLRSPSAPPATKSARPTPPCCGRRTASEPTGGPSTPWRRSSSARRRTSASADRRR